MNARPNAGVTKNDAHLKIANVSRSFRSRDGTDTVALDKVSLDIQQGEFIALVGASGCGKSTLLRIVCGLIAPTNGLVSLAGQQVTAPRDDTAMVFQAPTLLPWATILDNVLFPLRMRGTLKPESRDEALALLKLVGLQGFENKYPRELSGGMQQRAAICRGLVPKPSVLLMDEPFGALDALTREEMSLELLRIWTQQPKTVLFVTHSISEAVLLADRVVVMSPRPGRVAEVIPISLPRPRNFDQLGNPPAQDAIRRIRKIIYGDKNSPGAEHVE
jgi:NitT/TauT family transport system ATP-binding protein